MTRTISAIIILFILTAAGAAEPYHPAEKARLVTPENYSGVYKGYIDTFGVCGWDTTEATVYFDFGTTPVTIVYDGTVLQDYSYAGEVVYYTGYNKQIELGRFDRQNGKDGFIYKRILNHFYNGEPKDFKPFFLKKTGELKDNFEACNAYVADYNKFRVFWDEFETAFLKKDFDKCESLTNFPLMNRTVDPAVKIEKKDFKAFITKAYNEASVRIIESEPTYKKSRWFPQRFGDNDPCFAKTYTWSYPSPRFNFTQINGEYMLTNLYEYE